MTGAILNREAETQKEEWKWKLFSRQWRFLMFDDFCLSEMLKQDHKEG